jgi:hypothetical protein
MVNIAMRGCNEDNPALLRPETIRRSERDLDAYAAKSSR